MFIQQFLNALGLSFTYLLVALVYNLLFGVLKIINLAIGDLLAFSALVALWSMAEWGLAIPLAAVIAVIAGVALGAVVHLIAVAPLGDVSDVDSPRHLQVLVSTLGAGLILQNVAILLFGPHPRRFPTAGSIQVGPAIIDLASILNLVVTAMVLAGVFVLLRRTHFGARVRALSDNRVLAVLSGISPQTTVMAGVLLSSALAGASGFLIALTVGTVSPFLGWAYGLKGLVIVIVAGLGRMRAAVVWALVLGVVESFGAAYVSSFLKDGFAFALMLLFLAFRSYGRPSAAVA